LHLHSYISSISIYTINYIIYLEVSTDSANRIGAENV